MVKKKEKKTAKIKYKRITIDVDNFSIFGLLWRIFKAIRLNIFDRFDYKRTNRGYHLCFWSKRWLSRRKMFELRGYLGDDKNRIFLDSKKKYAPTQILFTTKTFKKL